ncbi:AraC family transcriptional regulator [Flavobacterium sp.]|uniref:helix-turn-helix domain-containing protein n=1 Tax=Flavobacterium sp. TaxID=239 RepID=UPI0026163A88|nr:AraC family transcriptional regulator [Flavobacterium sp.]MDG2431598.1 AraC family transcriptional regulator [Flavobacterium sp.]
MRLVIKNMVCGRCEMAVKNELDKLGVPFLDMRLGEVTLDRSLGEKEKRELSENLKNIGFELLDDKTSQTIERIKNLIVTLVHHEEARPKVNLSTYLAADLNQDYSALSNLFSENEGVTIERFFIAQKIERVKELLLYNELTLSEIAYQMHYSTVGHLSNQFKKTTGITPTQFKQSNEVKRKQIDEV